MDQHYQIGDLVRVMRIPWYFYRTDNIDPLGKLARIVAATLSDRGHLLYHAVLTDNNTPCAIPDENPETGVLCKFRNGDAEVIRPSLLRNIHTPINVFGIELTRLPQVGETLTRMNIPFRSTVQQNSFPIESILVVADTYGITELRIRSHASAKRTITSPSGHKQHFIYDWSEVATITHEDVASANFTTF